MTQTSPKRPSYRDPRVIAAAVEEILADVIGWLGEEERDVGEVRQQLIRCANDDAYRFAKELDSRAYWSPDADLVEILGSFSTWGARTQLIKQWVAENEIKVPYVVGDLLTLRGVEARVVRIQPETAEIVVQPTIPDGKTYGPTGGWVHAYEDAAPALSEPGA